MSKTYDRVEWSFVENVMLRLSFDRRSVELIMHCVRSSSYSFIINREVQGMMVQEEVSNKVIHYVLIFLFFVLISYLKYFLNLRRGSS